VLVDIVPLWWEVWRRLNGFPPALSSADQAKEDKSKPPKPPK
jgi:hypothetical protein